MPTFREPKCNPTILEYVDITGRVSAESMLVFHEGSKGILSTLNMLHSSQEGALFVHVFFMCSREARYYTKAVHRVVRERKKRLRVLTCVAFISIPDAVWYNKKQREAFISKSKQWYKTYEATWASAGGKW